MVQDLFWGRFSCGREESYEDTACLQSAIATVGSIALCSGPRLLNVIGCFQVVHMSVP